MSVSLKKWVNAILVAMLFACTLALFGPAQIFLSNSLEFNFSFSHLLPFLGLITFCIFLSVLLILMLLPDRFILHKRGVAVTLVLGLILWFQGNILVWRYGPLSGHEINWGGKIIYGLIDTPIWIVFLLMAGWRPAFLYRWAKTFALLILSIQLLSTSVTAFLQPELPSFKKFRIDHYEDFDFSSRENIIILVLDSFQADVFQEIIDLDPFYKVFFKDFTFFRNTTGGFPSTYAAIPLLLTGHYYNNSEPIQSFMASAYRSPSSLPYQLLQRGWHVNLVPAVQNTIYYDSSVFSNILARKRSISGSELARLYDITLFRYLPHFLKHEIYNDENWFLSSWVQKGDLSLLNEDEPSDNERHGRRFRRKIYRLSPHVNRNFRQFGVAQTRKSFQINSDSRFVSAFLMNAAVITKKSVFKFYHWRGPHEPIQMNANLEQVDLPLNRTNIVDLARGELKLVDLFLKGLRELDVYDQALIFILADHGHPWGTFGVRLPPALAEKSDGSGSIPKGVLESGIPLLLVKRPGDRGELRINDAPASQIDVSATIFDHLGLGQIGMGEPLFQIPTDRLRERHFFYYSWEHRNWMNRYLPALVEYHVMGHSWLPSSWRATGKVLRPDK